MSKVTQLSTNSVLTQRRQSERLKNKRLLLTTIQSSSQLVGQGSLIRTSSASQRGRKMSSAEQSLLDIDDLSDVLVRSQADGASTVSNKMIDIEENCDDQNQDSDEDDDDDNDDFDKFSDLGDFVSASEGRPDYDHSDQGTRSATTSTTTASVYTQLKSEQKTKKPKPKRKSKRFFKSDRSEVIDLLYGGENGLKMSSINADQDDDEDDQEDENILFASSKGDRPLLHRHMKRSEYGFDDDDKDVQEESTLSIVVQVFIPFLIAGFGTVGAGLVLDLVQHWEVFQKISEVFILVPALLGLKGNLEMTLASRLSTQANLGNLDSGIEQWKMATGNIALIQCQAAVVGFLAALFAIIMDWLPEGDFDLRHALLLCASSLLTASVASFVLGLVMILVVLASHKCHINPDNVATPIAASLGDLTTLSLLAWISNLLYYTVDNSIWLCSILIVIFLSLIPVWCLIAHRNKYTNDVLYTGWTPVISAMAISSVGGCILDFAVSRFSGIAVFQPVINGVGGNLVAVQASRISTYLHKRSRLGTLPRSDAKLCFSPCAAFYGKHVHAKTARVLLLMVIPGHLVFTYAINFVQAGHTSMTSTFLVVYLTAAMIQVFLLLYSAHVMILYMWRRKIDPDNSAIPYLTAIGDLLGTGLLAIAFVILFTIGDKDSDVGD